MSGPLSGVRVVEIAGIGPGPFCALMLADMGAEVVRVDRPTAPGAIAAPLDAMNRGRRSVAVDLKHPDGVATVFELVERADALIEGFRPGVAERLGIGPEHCLARNPGLVYGRMTGWGQDGPYAAMAGHDINYIALAGALHPIGRYGGPPVPPLNLVGDFGGGGMLLAFGVVCGILEARSSGAGQVVDASMVDGAALLTTMFHSMIAAGAWNPERGTNVLDTGSHYYDVYECADGEYISLGAIEPQFYAQMCEKLGLSPDDVPQHDKGRWPELKQRVAEAVRARTRAEWCAALEGTDVCFAPVLSMQEAPSHPHNVARGTFTRVDGILQPAPAPRFSRTPGSIAAPPARPGQHTDEILADWGFDEDRIAALRGRGAIA
jgi:alpha-methylacyl-CoA racemase